MLAARLGVFGAVVVSLSAPSPAMAVKHHPTGIFASFADCPLNSPAMSVPAVDLCLVARITGGELILGKKAVPIDHPITLQGGLIPDWLPGEQESREFRLVAAEDGNTLSHTLLGVPGGLTGTGGTRGVTAATATPELVGPTGGVELSEPNLATDEGTGLRLPMRVKLSSLTLGDNCYVGSASAPILLNLTTGTTSPPAPNEPMKGSGGWLSTEEQANGDLALAISGARLLENSFAVPAATGCGVYSSMIDADLGLPAPAGHNTAILYADVKEATAEVVKASE